MAWKMLILQLQPHNTCTYSTTCELLILFSKPSKTIPLESHYQIQATPWSQFVTTHPPACTQRCCIIVLSCVHVQKVDSLSLFQEVSLYLLIRERMSVGATGLRHHGINAFTEQQPHEITAVSLCTVAVLPLGYL